MSNQKNRQNIILSQKTVKKHTFETRRKHDICAIFPSPYNVRCRMSACVARKRQIFPFSYNQIRILIFGNYFWRNFKEIIQNQLFSKSTSLDINTIFLAKVEAKHYKIGQKQENGNFSVKSIPSLKHIRMYSLPTTSKYPERCLIGSVLIWHMYQPLSVDCTLCNCKIHSLVEGLLSEIRGLRVITLLWIVRIVCVSTRTQAT